MDNATAARAIKAAPRPAAQRPGPTPNGTQPEPLWLSIARTTSDCAAVIDEDGLVRFCNAAGARVLCPDEPDRVKGQLLSDFRAKHHANERVRLIRAALETGRAVIFESINAGVAYRTVIHPLDRAQDGKRCALFLGRPTYLPRDRAGLDGLPDAEGEVHRARSNDLGPLASITKRETEVLALIGRGMSTAEIADSLGRSVKTIEGHRVSLGSKLGVNNRVELARIAIRAGLAPFDRNHHEEASPPDPDNPKRPAQTASEEPGPSRNGTAVA
ncbi:MAG: LuxR C-terminal-related transcriptional regulator [Planctomycetota bacterium]